MSYRHENRLMRLVMRLVRLVQFSSFLRLGQARFYSEWTRINPADGHCTLARGILPANFSPIWKNASYRHRELSLRLLRRRRELKTQMRSNESANGISDIQHAELRVEYLKNILERERR